MDHSADDARHIRDARARKAERRREIVDARIADAIWRARFMALDCEIAAIRAASEAGLRADWRPAPQERARGCRLPACRRHGACQSDALRRVCGIPPTPTPEPLTWPEPRVPHRPAPNLPDSNDTEPSLPPTPAPRENRPSLDDLLRQLSPDIRREFARRQGEDIEDPQPVAENEPEPAEDAVDDDDDGLALPRPYDPCDFRNYAPPGADPHPEPSRHRQIWETGALPDRPHVDRAAVDRPAPNRPESDFLSDRTRPNRPPPSPPPSAHRPMAPAPPFPAAAFPAKASGHGSSASPPPLHRPSRPHDRAAPRRPGQQCHGP